MKIKKNQICYAETHLPILEQFNHLVIKKGSLNFTTNSCNQFIKQAEARTSKLVLLWAFLNL
jgi:hypothetical protein